ncbi:MAG: hypothetical protein ACD_75C00753G0002 [uncultured bacterium]|nr:MAG: hypothetical protein ACD_75C00753G0002 [uncultured bacterium]
MAVMASPAVVDVPFRGPGLPQPVDGHVDDPLQCGDSFPHRVEYQSVDFRLVADIEQQEQLLGPAEPHIDLVGGALQGGDGGFPPLIEEEGAQYDKSADGQPHEENKGRRQNEEQGPLL